jgi:hypothetical protein
MNFKRLLNTWLGKFFISVMLGLGIATLFNKACTDKSCLVFNGPILSEFDEKIYKYGEKCYKYTTTPTTCSKTKKIIDIQAPLSDEEKTTKQNDINSILLKTGSPVAAPSSSTGFSFIDNLFHK